MGVEQLAFGEPYFNGSPNGYTKYQRELWGDTWTFPGFAQRFFDTVGQRVGNLTGRTVLVVGCAYGFMVEELLNLGVAAYGMDISQYAIDQSPVPGRVLVGDVRSTADLDRARALAGLKGRKTFDVIVDEDALTCLSDADAVTACQAMRAKAGKVIHRLSVHDLDDYNTKPLADWKALCDPNGQDFWFVYTTWEEG